MSDICVELDAYIIPDDHTVWKLFPGKTYKFYDVMRAANLVFLDVRNLDLIAGPRHQWSDETVLRFLSEDRWSRETERASRLRRPAKGSAGVSRVDKRTLTFLKGLLVTAKKGDLVLLAPEGYRREVLIGEFLDDPGKTAGISTRDGEVQYSYLGRRVRWLPTHEKRFFSRALIDLLHTEAAFFQIAPSLYEEIYRVAYKSYVLGDVFASTFETTKQVFGTTDSAVVGTWFNALAAVRDAVAKGEGVGSESLLSLGLRKAEDAELNININSPGQYLLRTAGVFALVAMTMLELTDVAPADIVGGKVKVALKPVGNADPDCGKPIDKAIADYAKTLGIQRLQEHCEIGKRAKNEATLKTKARLKKAAQ